MWMGTRAGVVAMMWVSLPPWAAWAAPAEESRASADGETPLMAREASGDGESARPPITLPEVDRVEETEPVVPEEAIEAPDPSSQGADPELAAQTRPEEASGARVLLPDTDGAAIDTTQVGALSEGGTNAGALELSLGSIVGVISASLIANGIFQLMVGLDRADACAQPGAEADPQCFSVDRPGLRYAASGLSFAFAIPTAVASALWIRRGVRVNQDYRAYRAQQSSTPRRSLRIQPYVGLRGRAGLSLSLRF
jgi:hypothetical protein